MQHLRLGDLTGVNATIAVIATIGCLSLATVYAVPLTYLNAPVIRSDGIGYYLYLPAVFLDHDITMKRTVKRSLGGEAQGNGVVRKVPPHGDLLDAYGMGEAVMLAPFFGAGYVLAAVLHEDQTGFTRAYQVTAAGGGLVYMLLGLLVLASVLGRWFRPGTVVVTLIAITFGTDLFHYGTYDSLYSHAFSFLLVALILRLTLSIWDRPRASAAAALGAVTGLLALVRPTDLVILAFCGLVGIQSVADMRRRALTLARRFNLVALGALVAALAYLPQIAYWYAITGRPFAHAYPTGQNLELLHPHFVGVLFSARKGLFFWTPLLLVAVAGLPSLRRTAPGLLLPAVVYLLLQTWVVASWTIWWYGGSFGMRPFVEALPVFALGLAALVERARRGFAGAALYAGLAVTTLLAVHAMLAYWTKAIPYDHTTLHEYFASFGHL